MKKIILKLIIIICAINLFLTLTGCQENEQAKLQVNNADSNNIIYPSKDETLKDDSFSVAILSVDGKLLYALKYVSVEANIESYSRQQSDYLDYVKGFPILDTIIGDFNGDGKMDNAWLKDNGIEFYNDCQENSDKKSCKGIILFSDKTIKPLIIDYSPIYLLKNEGDLYGNGIDALGVLPGGFNGACRQYFVYTFTQGKWKLSCPSISNTLNMREAGIILIEKDLAQKGYAIIRESIDSYINSDKMHKIPEVYSRGSCCQWSNVVERRVKLN